MIWRRAYTLLEVLVVVAILGLLIGLALPAMQVARESSRRTECLHNQRNLGLAVLQFEQINHRFPGYSNVQAIDAGGERRPTGWVFPILPYLENQPLFELHGARGPDDIRGLAPNLLLPGLRCPSDPWAEFKRQETSFNATSYVANCGQIDVPSSTNLPPDWRANGVFLYQFPTDRDGKRVRTEMMTDGYMRSSDGTSRTLLLSENLDAGCWTDPGEADVGFVYEATLVDGRPAPLTLKRINEAAGSRWQSVLANVNYSSAYSASGLACVMCGGPPSSAPPPSLPPIWDIPDPPNEGDPEPVEPPQAVVHRKGLALARPSSAHSGGVVACYADGHASFLSQDIEYVTYCQLMSVRDERMTIPGTIDPVPLPYFCRTEIDLP